MCSSPIVPTQVVNLPDWALGPTVITVDLSYTNSTQVRQRTTHTSSSSAVRHVSYERWA